jgi:hypothetical protein
MFVDDRRTVTDPAIWGKWGEQLSEIQTGCAHDAWRSGSTCGGNLMISATGV